MIATVNSGVYKLVLVLHLLAVIVGFGPAIMSIFWGLKARERRGPEGAAIAQATFEVVGTYAEWAIYAVVILGIILVTLSGDVFKFSQAWVSLSFLLYIVYLGLYHGMQRPNLRRINELMATAGGVGVAGSAGTELEERGQRAALIGGVLDVLVVIVVFLMVYKPGL
jgi:uncharacterized membrane protein